METTQIQRVNVEGLCELIGAGKVEIGDRFVVTGRAPAAAGLITHDEEIVFRFPDAQDKRRVVDTLVVSQKGETSIEERRYFAEGQYRILLGFADKGTEDYHRLLEQTEGVKA